jgi:hypothetical protein
VRVDGRAVLLSCRLNVDGPTILAVVVTTTTVVVAATYLPALRASRIDPMLALRSVARRCPERDYREALETLPATVGGRLVGL